MAYWLECDCGHISLWDSIEVFQANPKCEPCGRRLRGLPNDESKTPIPTKEEDTFTRYFLVSADGKFSIHIPKEGGIVGRDFNNIGWQELSSNLTVSRNHLEITHFAGSKFRIRDLGSRNHTSLNGLVIMPDELKTIGIGDIITLATQGEQVELILSQKEEA